MHRRGWWAGLGRGRGGGGGEGLVAREVELKQSTHIETDVKHSPRGEKSNALENHSRMSHE